ncbi:MULTISPECIES: hypothetical protein [unclassified Streptomyces]|uniref:hypothetical protein n=1 Tax=unclassified Streptomyces TaxID=2593676 RepID=UPI001909A4BD|nr:MULTISPECIES: hypothetical protein [unclassified Streptomyces]MBK3563308.1 hypothetical protein [Streptomyces sp. MBT62]MBK6012163.1 hypothetical protein [Streptomyces sp. MBT53]
MARADTLARARTLTRPELAYLVRFPTPDGIRDMELTWAELARDTDWVTARFRDHGLAAGQRALLTTSGFEGFWGHAVIGALRALKVPYGIAEAMGWDHRRTAVFHRELDPHAVIGLSAETLEGLAGATDVGSMFRTTPVVLARPAAVPMLRGVGVSAAVIATVGPALALECPERGGAHVNAAEWRVDARDGQLSVAAGEERTSELPETQLGIAGRVLTGRCACGSEDPRVLFAEANQSPSSRS